MLKKEELSNYITRSKRANTEPSKALQFLLFIKDVFKAVDIDYFERKFPDMEKFVSNKEKTIVKRGRIDTFLENLIIEFEKDLNRTLEESKRQLRQYVAALWNKEKTKIKYLAISSDGINFYVYRPRALKENNITEDDIRLDEIDRKNFEYETPEEIFTWLDRYFLSQEFLIPKTESFSQEFGSKSPLFKIVKSDLEDTIEELSNDPSFQTIFQEWSKYLAIVYGSSIESKDLFIKHTYLSMLSKLMIYSFYSKGQLPSEKIVEKILSGGIFEEWGIKNFIVEDFFVWIIREPSRKKGIEISKKILEKLSKYDLSTLDEDVLKGLYQELVDPEERHDLGEYYTPDWLAEYMLRELLKKNPIRNILDPSCGSGTFLFTAIKLKKQFLKDMNSKRLLYHIIHGVVGIDIHPLAVIIAKTNYLLALGELLQKDRDEIILPIYMADSIRLVGEETGTYFKIRNYKIPTIDNKTFLLLPADFLDKYVLNPDKIDQLIDLIRIEAENLAKSDSYDKNLFIDFLKNSKISDKNIKLYLDSLYKSVETFSDLIKKNKDTIWGFIFKNKYKPLYLLKRKFDVIIGNPPWLTYNSVKNPEYQTFLKELITKTYGLTKKAELITHMELATLFFIRCSELYLKDGGVVSFILPRSVYVSDHHSAFRNASYTKPDIKFYYSLDLEKVKPLFNVPSCVVFGTKGKKTTYPIFLDIIQGNLEKKNESYSEALKKLQIKNQRLFLSKIGERDFLSSKAINVESGQRSYYYEKFEDGATLYPRPLCFVEIKKHPMFGLDKKYPFIETSKRAIENAKKPYDDVKLSGNIENDFLFGTLTGSELVPFGYLDIQIVALPIISEKDNFRIIDFNNSKLEKYDGLKKWLNNAENIWSKKRGAKSSKMNYLEQINYRNKLVNQNPNVKFKVLFTAHGKYLTSSVIKNEKIKIQIYDDDFIYVNNFVVDHALFYFDTNNEAEAYYLTSILNSSIIDKIIKPMQAKGLFGERSIHKKPLELPIPKFESKSSEHLRLSELGKMCTKKVEETLPKLSKKYQSIGKIRSEIRSKLKEEIEEIDVIVKKILSESSNKSYNLKRYINSK